MTMAIRWGAALLVLAGLGWLVWWSGWLTNKNVPNTQAQNTNATSTPEQGPINGMSANNDASDQAIAQDTAAIDAQIKAYATDTGSVDSSMNDKPIAQ